MTSKEKKLKAIIELATVQARIEELKRAKTYLNGSTYYRTRLNSLEDKAEKLSDIVEGREESAGIKLVFELPEMLFKGTEKPQDIIQYLQKEYLVLES